MMWTNNETRIGVVSSIVLESFFDRGALTEIVRQERGTFNTDDERKIFRSMGM